MKKFISMMVLFASMHIALYPMACNSRDSSSPASMPGSPSLRKNYSEEKSLNFCVDFTVREATILSKDHFVDVQKQEEVTILCKKNTSPSQARVAMIDFVGKAINRYLEENLQACSEREKKFDSRSRVQKINSYNESQVRMREDRKLLDEAYALQEAVRNIPDALLTEKIKHLFAPLA